jgi:hypothetical protein
MTSINGSGFNLTSVIGNFNDINDLATDTLKQNEDVLLLNNKIICKDLEVLNTTILNTTTVVNASDVEITDRTLLLGKGNQNSAVALVFDASNNLNNFRRAGILYNSTEDKLKIFKTGQNLTGAVVNEADGTFTLQDLHAGAGLFNKGFNGDWGINSTPSLELGTVNSQSGVLRIYGTTNSAHSTIQNSSNNLHLDCPTSASVGTLINHYTTTKPIILNGSGVRVGNGAFSPFIGYRLDCDGSLRVNGATDILGNATLTAAGPILNINSTSANSFPNIDFRRSGTARWGIGLNGTAGAILDTLNIVDYTNNTRPVSFKTNTVANGGTFVGIGTTDPQEKLHVVGNSRIDGNAQVNGAITATSSVNARNAINLTRTGEASAVTLTAYAASIGLGGVVNVTSSAGRASGLQITNTDNNHKWFVGRTYIGGSANSSRFVIGGIDGDNTTAGSGMFEVAAGAVRVYTPAIVATLGNNVGVNVATPLERFHVGGNARIDGRTIINNDTLQLASLTTVQRDDLVGVANGALIFNSTTGNIEKYESNAWSALSSGGSITESSLSAHTIVLKGALSANVNTTWNFYKVGKLVHARYDFFSGNTNTIGLITTVSGQIPVDYRPASLFQSSVFHPDSAMKVYPVEVDTSGNFTLKNNTGGNFPSGVSVTVFAGYLSWVTA